MNIDCFMKRFANVLMNDDHDSVFETIKIIARGTTSTRIAKLLNFAVTQMDSGECYLEVGVYTGATLCSASHCTGQPCIGIDPYKADSVEFQGNEEAGKRVRDACLSSIRYFGGNIRLIEKDFKDVSKEEIGSPIAVSFIDGAHTYEGVTDNLAWLEPLLANDAVIVFDDVNFPDVSRAIFDWLASHNGYDLLAYVRPRFGDSQYTYSLTERFLNNGVCIVRYNKT